jgi:hypothetical protein
MRRQSVEEKPVTSPSGSPEQKLVKRKILQEERTPSEEEEVGTQHLPVFKQPQPEPGHTPAPLSEQAKSPALGRTKPPRPARPSPLLRPKKDNIPTPRVQPQRTGSELEENLGSFALDAQKWELKIDWEKLVVAANRGSEKVALKISPGQGHFLQENVVAATWIKILGINGVTAPEMHLLSDNDIARVLEAAKQKDATKTAEVRQAVDDMKAAKSSGVFTAGSISQLVPESVANYEIGLQLGETTLTPPRSTDQAKEEIQELLKLLVVSGTPGVADKQITRFLESLDKGEYDRCLVAQDVIKEGKVVPGRMWGWLSGRAGEINKNLSEAARKEKKWRLIFLVEYLGGSKAPKATEYLKPARDQQARADRFKAWLNTDEGLSAFIGMACVDLLFGMEDRILGRTNLGNFSFDPGKSLGDGKLWCFDNAKLGPGVAVGEDANANFKNYTGSKNWASDSPSPLFEPNLVQYVRDKINETGLWGDNPVVTEEMVSDKLASVLDQASTAIKNNPDIEGANALEQRINYITTKTAIQSALSHQPTATASTTSTFMKILRAPLSLKSGVKSAHKAKATIRGATDLDSLKTVIATAQQNLAKASGGQAYKKAELELEAALFAVSLHEAVTLCRANNSTISKEDRDAMQHLYGQWSANPDTDIQGLLTVAWNEWQGLPAESD